MKRHLFYPLLLLFVITIPIYSQSYYLVLGEKMVYDNYYYQSPRKLTSICEMIFDADNMKVYYMETFESTVQYYWDIVSIERSKEFENVFYWNVDNKHQPLETIELNLSGNKVNIGNEIFLISKNTKVSNSWIQTKLSEVEEKLSKQEQFNKYLETDKKSRSEAQEKRDVEKSKLPIFGYFENDTSYYVIYFRKGINDSMNDNSDFNLSFYLKKWSSNNYDLPNWFFYRKNPPAPILDETKAYVFLKDCDVALDAIKYLEKYLKISKLCEYCISDKQKVIELWNRVYIKFYEKKNLDDRNGEYWDEEKDIIKVKAEVSYSELVFGTSNPIQEMDKYINNFLKEKKKSEN
jgi:hypothetical protein